MQSALRVNRRTVLTQRKSLSYREQHGTVICLGQIYVTVSVLVVSGKFQYVRLEFDLLGVQSALKPLLMAQISVCRVHQIRV